MAKKKGKSAPAEEKIKEKKSKTTDKEAKKIEKEKEQEENRERLFKRFFFGELGLVALALCITVALSVFPLNSDDPSSDEQSEEEIKFGNDKTTLDKAFGGLFGINGSEFNPEQIERPDGNSEIPFKDTLLFHAFDYVDKYNLYLKCKQHTLSDTGYTTFETEYAIKGKKIYIHMVVDGVPLYYLSDGERLLGLDFEEKTYTVLSPSAYTPEELLYMGNFQFCTATGKDIFLGEELVFEDYTINNKTSNEWIRYYFKDDGTLAGYIRYNGNGADGEMQELTSYQQFTSEIPEDAVLHFDIPAGFTEYTDIIDWSDIMGDDY